MTHTAPPSPDTKKCPFCAEEIKAEAIKCRHCGEMLNQNEVPAATGNGEDQQQVCCPMCGSTQVSAQKKGFGLGKALFGGVLTGGIGLLAGFHGSRGVLLTCLKCGHSFKPGAKQLKLKSIAKCTCGNSVFDATSEKPKPDLKCKRCGSVYAYPTWDAEVGSGKKGTVVVRLTTLGSAISELTLIGKE